MSEAIEAYKKGELWFKISEKHGLILDEIAKMTYKKMLNNPFAPEQEDEEVFAHLVVSHAFIEFLGITGLSSYVGAGKYRTDEDEAVYWKALRKIYDRFAEVNEIPENLRELGWRKFLED